MKKVLFFMLLMASFASAQFIYFVSAEQYQTISGWRLHVILDMAAMPWPPSNYERTELLLSTMPMGVHEPYSPIATLERKIAERDPEFLLLGEMMTDVTWYGRVMIYANGTLTAYTDEFTFVLPGDETIEPTGMMPWVASDDTWSTSIALTNPGEQQITVTITGYSLDGSVRPIGDYSIQPHRTIAWYPLSGVQFYGHMEMIGTGTFGWMEIITDGNKLLGFYGEVK